jgi:hypothetical protein
MADYHRLMDDDRPVKFDQGASTYRKANGDPRCDQCQHFYQRFLDKYGVCEIVRPVPEEEIRPDWTCKFQTKDGKRFPLYPM